MLPEAMIPRLWSGIPSQQLLAGEVNESLKTIQATAIVLWPTRTRQDPAVEGTTRFGWQI